MAVFRKLSEEHFQLERALSNHLLLPMTAFAGCSDVLQKLKVEERDSVVKKISGADVEANLIVQREVQKGDPKAQPETQRSQE